MLLKHFQVWAETLSESEVRALQLYQGSMHGVLNAALVGAIPMTIEDRKLRDTLDRALFGATLPYALTVHRAMPLEEFRGISPGSHIAPAAYVSTSLDPAVAIEHAQKHLKAAIARFHLPKDFPAAFLPAAGVGSEEEVLIPRNTTFRVIGAKGRTEGAVGYVEVHLEPSYD